MYNEKRTSTLKSCTLHLYGGSYLCYPYRCTGMTTDITPFQAILWCFYPVAFLVGLELFLRASGDDDDDDEGGGVMSPVGVYQGA